MGVEKQNLTNSLNHTQNRVRAVQLSKYFSKRSTGDSGLGKSWPHFESRSRTCTCANQLEMWKNEVSPWLELPNFPPFFIWKGHGAGQNNKLTPWSQSPTVLPRSLVIYHWPNRDPLDQRDCSRGVPKIVPERVRHFFATWTAIFMICVPTWTTPSPDWAFRAGWGGDNFGVF